MCDSPNVFRADRDSRDSACEPVCEPMSDSDLGEITAVTETLAIQRDRRTGRFERSSLAVSRDDAPALGAETRFRPGSQAARRHGVRAFQLRGEAALEADQRAALEAFRAGLVADQGGCSELTTIGAGYVRRLCDVEAICALMAADLAARGILTQRGRVRSTYAAFLQVIDRWDRLAQRLGIGRRERRIPSLAEYLAQRAAIADDDRGMPATQVVHVPEGDEPTNDDVR